MTALETAFWAFVQQCTHRPPCHRCCWPWQGPLTPQGYGRLLFEGQSYAASRLALEFAHGALLFPPAPTLMVRLYGSAVGYATVHRFLGTHTCDHPPCCNPSHLLVGTHGDNSRDMASKGRGNRQRTGETL